MTPVNCERFLDHGGIDLFLDCCYMYPEDESLTKKMVGMMVSQCNIFQKMFHVDALRVLE